MEQMQETHRANKAAYLEKLRVRMRTYIQEQNPDITLEEVVAYYQEQLTGLPKKHYQFVFTGNLGCGKTTACGLLETLLSTENVQEFHFADTLKYGCSFLAGLNYEQLFGDEKNTPIPRFNQQKSSRAILQEIGSYCRDNFHKDIFVDNTRQRMRDHSKVFFEKNPGKTLVQCIGDARFDNELRLMTDVGAMVCQIERPNNQIFANLDPSLKAHESENGVSRHLVDYFYVNGGSFVDYADWLLSLLDLPSVNEVLDAIQKQKN